MTSEITKLRAGQMTSAAVDLEQCSKDLGSLEWAQLEAGSESRLPDVLVPVLSRSLKAGSFSIRSARSKAEDSSVSRCACKPLALSALSLPARGTAC
jgi:hypothetical protein